MFNKNLRILDCTIRDGGLINKWQFSMDFARGVFNALHKAGVDYMEVGYRASEKIFSPKEYGLWRFCQDSVLRDMVGDTKTSMKLGVMVDIGRVDPDDLAPKHESPVDFIRVATYLKDIDKAIALANLVKEKGYETFINIMAISTVNDYDLSEALRQIDAECQLEAVSVVDSNGALYPANVAHFVNMFTREMKKTKSGFHGHNNLQLGFANSIQALESGAAFCDATINGIGRAAGNCPLELLISWLKNPKYELEPALQVIQDLFVPLSREIEWGYLIPYMITGVLNEHPRVGINLRAGEQKDNYSGFYRSLTTPECLEDKKARQQD
jgi:4-hydroxy 2-oxovalerate aldolase